MVVFIMLELTRMGISLYRGDVSPAIRLERHELKHAHHGGKQLVAGGDHLSIGDIVLLIGHQVHRLLIHVDPANR
ncbi:hypothetical protein D3C84_1280920 [compost metagenome]